MAIPDPMRIGGLAWTRQTKGRLSPRERRQLLGAIAAALGEQVAGRIRYATGRVPAGAHALSAEALAPPDSALAKAAEAACDEQPRSLIGHGYRTWMFGAGLAALDGVTMDGELFYVASLLHDYGIINVIPGEDFTLRSVERLERCARDANVEPSAVETAADGMTVHATPGITVDTDGALGTYVQAGAMFDLAGTRAGDLTRAYRDHVIHIHPRDGVSADVAAMVKAEAKANPDGRFALLRRCGLPELMKLNPLRPR
jgi:hypothetical protein